MKFYLFFILNLAAFSPLTATEIKNHIKDFHLNLTQKSPLFDPFIALAEIQIPSKKDLQEDKSETQVITKILPSDTRPITQPMPPPLKYLSLVEALVATIKFQDDIKISQLEVGFQLGLAQEDAGPFDPVFDAEIEKIYIDDPQALAIGLKTDLDASDLRSSYSLIKKTRPGTIFSILLENDRGHNPLFPLEGVAPSTTTDTSSIAFRVEQPLLRDFWYGTEAMTEQSDYMELRALIFDNLGNISQRILDTTIQYWEWVAAKKLLEIRQAAENQYIKLVQDTEELIKKDQLAANDINQPLAVLATQKINSLFARQNLFNAFQNLKLTMGVAMISFCEDVEDWGGEDFPDAEFDTTELDYLKSALLEYAIKSRYDIRASSAREVSVNLLLKGAYNGRLPKLNLFGGVRSSNFALGADANCLYSANSARKPQTDWSVGVSFSMPFYNDRALGIVQQLESRLWQVRFRTDLLTQTTVRDVQEALLNQLSLLYSLKEAKLAVERNKTLYENEREKLQGGFSTIFFLIDFQNRLTEALVEYVDIHKQYMQNIARLRFFTSTLISPGNDLVSIQIENVSMMPDLRIMQNLEYPDPKPCR